MDISSWSSAIQAISALASVALVFWIARLTARYTDSTDRILKATQESGDILREQLEEIREDRRAPVRNLLDHYERQYKTCLLFDAMSAEELRSAADQLQWGSTEIRQAVRLRDSELARTLRLISDIGSERISRHIEQLYFAVSAEKNDLIQMHAELLRKGLRDLGDLIAAGHERLKSY